MGSWIKGYLSSSLFASSLCLLACLKLFQSLFKDVAILALSSFPNLTSQKLLGFLPLTVKLQLFQKCVIGIISKQCPFLSTQPSSKLLPSRGLALTDQVRPCRTLKHK